MLEQEEAALSAAKVKKVAPAAAQKVGGWCKAMAKEATSSCSAVCQASHHCKLGTGIGILEVWDRLCGTGHDCHHASGLFG